jgi:hypothetical protein
MSIKRGSIPADRFTIISNDWLRDPRLSWKAKGLLAYIASHAKDYRLTTEQIMSEGKEARDAVRSGLRELEEAGYLRRVDVRDERGRLVGTDHELTEPDGTSVAGKPVASPDLREHDVSPAQSSDGKPVPGYLSSKKTKKTSSEEGDAEAPPATPEPSEPSTEPNAGSIVADWIDYCGGRDITLTKQAIGRYARKIKELIEEGFSAKLIKRALALQLDRGKAAFPGMLDSFMIEIQGLTPPGSRAPGSTRQAYQTAAEKGDERRERAAAIAQIADELQARDGSDPRDPMANMKITEEARRIYDSRSTTCNATGYTGPDRDTIVDAEWTEHPTARREVTAG